MPRPRCSEKGCRRRLTPVDMIHGACKCGGIFCAKHRLPESHTGDHDWSVDEKAVIKENRCVADKMESTNGSSSRLS